MISETIIVAILALVGTLTGSWMTSQKTQWRLDQLEKKQDKHNDIVERFAIMEHDEQAQWKRIDELWEDMERLKEEHCHEQ